MVREAYACCSQTTGKSAQDLFLTFYLFFEIYAWPCWVVVAVLGPSLVAAVEATCCWGAWASHCGGCSCCTAWALGVWASVVMAQGLGSGGAQA